MTPLRKRMTKHMRLKGYSPRTIKSYVNMVAVYARHVGKIPRPKRAKTLPAVMSVEEVERLLRSLANIKHRTILQVLYGTGLRVSELVGLRIADIDSDRNTITVRHGKGAKDRQLPLSPTLLQLLREYWKVYRPQEFLFENGRSGAQMSGRTVQAVFEYAKKVAGIAILQLLPSPRLPQMSVVDAAQVGAKTGRRTAQHAVLPRRVHRTPRPQPPS